MPRTKREGIFYGVIMAFTMSIFMNLFNTFSHAGISIESLKKALLLQPVIFAIVMIVEGVAISKIAQKAAKRLVHEKDSPKSHALARSLCMATGMSIAMSIIGLILAGTQLSDFPVRFASSWPVNFCVAFWWQFLAAGPIARTSLKMLQTYKPERVMLESE